MNLSHGIDMHFARKRTKQMAAGGECAAERENRRNRDEAAKRQGGRV